MKVTYDAAEATIYIKRYALSELKVSNYCFSVRYHTQGRKFGRITSRSNIMAKLERLS